MLRSFGRHVRQQFVGYLALFIALGGVSYAAVTLPINSVGSKQIKRGAVKNSDLGKSAVTTGKVKNGSLLSTDFKPGQLVAGAPGGTGPQGPQGLKGNPGTNGTNGAPATALWAVVGGDGTLARGSHVVSTSQSPGVAAYTVVFDRDVSNCAFLAGLGGTDTDIPIGEVTTRRSSKSNVNGVWVGTYNSAGTNAARQFHLAVFC